MQILHVTPHLPPDQAANALLPWQLGVWARDAGHTVEYVAHPAHRPDAAQMPGPVTWVSRRRRTLPDRLLRWGAVSTGHDAYRALRAALPRADIVHVHSNGLLAELSVLVARRRGIPVVLTLYGTEIWHYEPGARRIDLFTRAYRAASAVTFYSERLLARAGELGLTRRRMQTIYPPVSAHFQYHDEAGRAAARTALGFSCRHLLLNVKRLHPLAAQETLIEALSEVIRTHPDTRLVLCGTGPLLDRLRGVARSCGVERHVVFAGMLDNAVIARYCAAADLFVLPSRLEALPTVAVEAVASGTPVLSTDNPGGMELRDLFGPDVSVVPRDQPIALAAAITEFLAHKRRTSEVTRAAVDREFRPDAVARRYGALYEELIEERHA